PSFGRPELVTESNSAEPASAEENAMASEDTSDTVDAGSDEQATRLMLCESFEASESDTVAAEGAGAIAVIEDEPCSLSEDYAASCADCATDEETAALEAEFKMFTASCEDATSEALPPVSAHCDQTTPAIEDVAAGYIEAVEFPSFELSDSSEFASSTVATQPSAADFDLSFPAQNEVAESAATISAPSEPAAISASAGFEESFEEPVVQSFPGPDPQGLLEAPAFLDFFNLNEQPFGVTPDPAYIYPSRMHSEALVSLSQGIQNLRGFMTLIAEPGMGKTTLLNKLMEQLRNSARFVFLFQTQCSPREILSYLLGELGMECSGMDLPAMHRMLNEILFREMMQGRRFVLIVDEAQNLDEATLETIRLLSDFETSNSKLIQIVLSGQPQLVESLRQPGLTQLRQRIAVLSNLYSLSAEETANYVQHRLRAAGANGDPIFTEEALALIAGCSQGTPRKINNLCFDALALACSEGRRTIDADIVQRVDSKLSLDIFSRNSQAAASDSQSADPTLMGDSSQLARLLLSALANHNQPESASSEEGSGVAHFALTGKITEIIKTWSGSKNGEYRVQVSLRRGASSEIPVAERYYSCSFYVGEKEAKSIQVGQSVALKIEQN
ncbi:MAG: AAA family ATPase, partial [Candidatus Acidiferrales bacterium]